MPNRNTNQTLTKQNTLLEARVEVQNHDLAVAVRELEAFTYSVTHDLRAPLRAINSFSRILLDEHGACFEGEALDFMQRINRASARMSELIDDLLKLSRVGRGVIETAPVDLSALINDVYQRLAEREPHRDVTLNIEPGMVVRGHARLLRIVLENILGNAWKFTRFRHPAVIDCRMTEDTGRRLISMSDNGTGFDMRYHHKLFAPFQRLHDTTEFEGTGIGLVTVARIIERHGGEVSIIGTEGKGATVSIFLPA